MHKVSVLDIFANVLVIAFYSIFMFARMPLNYFHRSFVAVPGLAKAMSVYTFRGVRFEKCSNQFERSSRHFIHTSTQPETIGL